MDALKAINAMGAERASNRAVLNEGGRRTVVGRVVEGAWQLTEQGAERAKAMEPARRKRQAKPAHGQTEDAE